MKKNRIKILLTIITVLTSTVFFYNEVEANTIMLLNCEYFEQCENDSDCLQEVDTFMRYTDNKGNIDWKALYKDGNNYRTRNLENEDYCWIDDYAHLNDKCKESNTIGWKGRETYYDFFSRGICPSGVREDKNIGSDEIVPAGTDGRVTELTQYLENPKYIIYKYTDTDGKERMIAEGYNKDGKYCLIGPDLTVAFVDEIASHQIRILARNIYFFENYRFFDVDTNFYNLIISGYGESGSSDDKIPECVDELYCKNEHGYEVVMSSSNTTAIEEGVKSWISTNNESFKLLEKISKILEDETFVDEIEKLNNSAKNGKSYKFKSSFTNEDMVSKLEEAYEGLKEAYSDGAAFVDCATGKETSAISAFTSCEIYQNYLGIKQISDIITNKEDVDTEHMINQYYIVEMIVDQVREEFNRQITSSDLKINILDSDKDLKKYTEIFYYAASYMKADPTTYFLDENQIQRINNLVEKFKNLVEIKGLEIYPVINCEELLGKDLIDKINSYLNIVKIAIPIIVIAFGIIDFSKAVFAGEEDTMKESQKKFIKRLGIAILIFFVPTIVNLILQLANKVWPKISKNSCGLLETKEKACYVCGNSQSGKYVWRTDEQSSSCTKYSSAKTKKDCEAMNNK